MTRLMNQKHRTILRKPSRRAVRPTLEGLEDRQLLYATLGGAWAYGSRITYSFAPDGTSVGGVSSNLFATLNGVTSTANWQAAIHKAAAIWSSFANINLALVSDDGSAFGVNGNQQGDSRFGDIRFAMIPQSTGALAFSTLPPPFNGGTNAGDIVFNSNVAWKLNSDFDVQTVALHEMGHALGLDHSALQTAVLYAYYNGIKQSLTSDDQAGIQAVYGAFPSDPINNGSFTTATNINAFLDANGQIALANQSLSGTSDLDFYVVTVPANTTGTMTVSMQSTNLSTVSPRVALFNGNRTSIGQTSLPNSLGATATYSLNNVSPGQVYYIRATAASSLGSYGAFGLLVNFGSAAQPPIAPPNTVVPRQPDQGGGSVNVVGPEPDDRGLDALLARPHGRAGGLDRHLIEIIEIGDFKAYGESLTVDDRPRSAWFNRLDDDGSSIPDRPRRQPRGPRSAIDLDATDPRLASIAIAPWIAPSTQAHDSALEALDDDWVAHALRTKRTQRA